MKDYYDLYKILQHEKYNPATLQEAIIHTFENRHTPYITVETLCFLERSLDIIGKCR